MGLEQFARERLGKSSWPADETGRFGVISRAAWQACEDSDAAVVDPVDLGVAVSPDGRSAAIVACGAGTDGVPVVEMADHRPGEGCGWVGPRLAGMVRDHQVPGVCWDDDSMAGPLSLASAIGDAAAVTPKGGELAAACGALFYNCEERALRHGGGICGCRWPWVPPGCGRHARRGTGICGPTAGNWWQR